jgi:hypothetical protein
MLGCAQLPRQYDSDGILSFLLRPGSTPGRCDGRFIFDVPSARRSPWHCKLDKFYKLHKHSIDC